MREHILRVLWLGHGHLWGIIDLPTTEINTWNSYPGQGEEWGWAWEHWDVATCPPNSELFRHAIISDHPRPIAMIHPNEVNMLVVMSAAHEITFSPPLGLYLSAPLDFDVTTWLAMTNEMIMEWRMSLSGQSLKAGVWFATSSFLCQSKHGCTQMKSSSVWVPDSELIRVEPSSWSPNGHTAWVRNELLSYSDLGVIFTAA